MASSDHPDRTDEPTPFWQRIFFAIPVIGWIARDLVHGDKDNIWYFLVMVISLWAISAMTFGVPGLYIPAVVLVPIVFLVLFVITWG